MVRAEYQGSPYATKLTCREHQLIADVTAEKGGLDAGLRPHDFLEASLASCLQITLRMYAQKHGIEVGETSVTVELERSVSAARFQFTIVFDPCCDEGLQARLREVLLKCPVKTTLSQPIEFHLKS